MADGLCGPSNALQSFQKHTSVDRTLQQDRLASRQSPTQGFRSSLGPNIGALDPEFDAFQAGHAPPPPQAFQHLPPQFQQHQHQQQQFAQAPAGPDWASDFQRLNIGPAHQHPAQRLQQQQAQVSNAETSWYQDFGKQMWGSSIPTQAQPQAFSQHGNMSGVGMGMGAYRPMYGGVGGMNGMRQEIGNGKQRAEESVPKFDDAAFEAAFEQAQRDMVGEAETMVAEQQETRNDPSTGVQDHMMQEMLLEQQNKQRLVQAREKENHTHYIEETDPVLLRIRDKRPPVYMAIKLRSEIDLGRSAEALPYLRDLEELESRGVLTVDASEAKWCVDTLQRSIIREVPQEITDRVENLIKTINERLMSSYPLLATGVPIRQENIWDELRAAGYTTDASSLLEREGQQPEQEKAEQQPPRNDDDEMAETAGRLLERVADNTSEKFQNSQFLELMRRLRDREVRVEEDKIVENSSASHSTPETLTDERIPVEEQDLDIGRSGPSGASGTAPAPPVYGGAHPMH